jgi:hypothetical protein
MPGVAGRAVSCFRTYVPHQIAHGDTFHDGHYPELDDAVQIEARQNRSGNWWP